MTNEIHQFETEFETQDGIRQKFGWIDPIER
jgi:hypothetical protein